MKKFSCVVVSCPSRAEAARIAEKIVKMRLAACAQTLGPVASIYWWKGKLQKGREFLVVLKTQSRLFDAVCRKIRDLHSFEVPEILCIPINKGLPSYLNWITQETKLETNKKGSS